MGILLKNKNTYLNKKAVKKLEKELAKITNKHIRLRIQNAIFEPLTSNPFDNLFRYFLGLFEEDAHVVLGLPGIFSNIEESSVIKLGESEMQADSIMRVISDDEMIKKEVIFILEHLSYRITLTKKEALSDYEFYQILKHHKKCFIFVITSDECIDCKQNEYGYFYKDFEVDGLPLRVFFIRYNDETIQKNLNTLTDKVNDNLELDSQDLLRFVFNLIFVKPDFADEIIDKSIEILKKANSEHIFDMSDALITIIKYHFRNDIKRMVEMLKMNMEIITQKSTDGYDINENVQNTVFDRYHAIEHLGEFKIENDKLKHTVYDLHKELDEKNKALDESYKALAESNKALDEMNKSLVEKDNDLHDMNKRLIDMENSLNKFLDLLFKKGIAF